MKAFFWRKNRKTIKNTTPVAFSKLDENKQKEILKKGAENFSVKFTKMIERLSNE